MTLSAIVPVLNEETFVPIYLKSVAALADEIIVVDGGSTDRTLEQIEKFQKHYPIRVFSRPQEGQPYADWNQPEVRNFLLDQAKGDWVLIADIDEIFDDRIREVLPEMLQRTDVHAYQFPFYNFWKDPNTLRVNAEGDARWSTEIIRLIRNGIGIRYEDKKRHGFLQVDGVRSSFWKLPRVKVDIPLYHYHYALGPRIKYNDNRRADVNRYNNVGEPDWDYKNPHYDIVTAPFTGEHPSVIREYLSTGRIEP